MPAPIDLKCEFEVEYRSALVADLDRHQMAMSDSPPTDRIASHIGQRTGCLFLHLFYGGEFQTFLIRENLVTLYEVKIIPLHQTRTTTV